MAGRTESRTRFSHQSVAAWSYAVVCLAAGCASSAPPSAKDAAPVAAATSDVAQYLPLVHDTVFAYDTVFAHNAALSQDAQVDPQADRGVLMMQVNRLGPDRADLTIGGKVRHLKLEPDGIRYLEGGYLLKAPLTPGAEWRGAAGTVLLTRTGLAVKTPAGAFEGCLETAEDATAGDSMRHTTTVFCPNTGIVSLRAEILVDGELVSESAVLRSATQRVDIYTLEE